jgi:hypothetical protein
MGGDADSQPFPRCPPPAAPCEIPSTSLSAHESLLSPLLEWKETDFWRRGRLPPRRESAPENELVRLAEVIVVDERREKRRQIRYLVPEVYQTFSILKIGLDSETV